MSRHGPRPRRAASAILADAQWSDGTKSIWFMSVEQNPAMLGIGRLGVLGYDTVTDVLVNGHAGYVATLASDTTIGEFVTLAWAAGDYTTFVGAYGFTQTNWSRSPPTSDPATTGEWTTNARLRTDAEPGSRTRHNIDRHDRRIGRHEEPRPADCELRCDSDSR